MNGSATLAPHSPSILWGRFRESFKTALQQTDHTTFATAWSTSIARTQFYRGILERVADDLELQLLREEGLLADFALCTKDPARVPLVFVESENAAWTADQSVWKLCALAAPVRVLISVDDWDASPTTPWKHRGYEPQRLEKWRSIAKAFGEQYGKLTGVVATIVGELRPDQTFRLYAHSIGGEAWLDENESIFLERSVRAPADKIIRTRLIGERTPSSLQGISSYPMSTGWALNRPAARPTNHQGQDQRM